jgi:hypothetical protein
MNKHLQWTTEMPVLQWLREQCGFPGDLHLAWFIPNDWPGKGKVVDLGLPECEMHWCAVYDPDPDKIVMAVNCPVLNRDIEYWIKPARQQAKRDRAPLMLSCDTAQQVDDAVRIAEKYVPRNHRRLPLERIYDPKDRADKPLS